MDVKPLRIPSGLLLRDQKVTIILSNTPAILQGTITFDTLLYFLNDISNLLMKAMTVSKMFFYSKQ